MQDGPSRVIGEVQHHYFCSYHNLTPGVNIVTDPGYFSEWAKWEPCTVTCGGGQRQRTRSCVLPDPTSDPCVGLTDETETCNAWDCDST